MATVATIHGTIVGLQLPTDVESDTNQASQGSINVKVNNVAGQSGFITLEPVAASVFANVALGDSVTIAITDP